ncbi:MAG: HD domain-containing protein [Prolixibacteraceae bacterium]|nr:HD domain-containing protein [Prolixibacteraceae bacterium]
MQTNKRKILNDPVFGFISLHSDIIFDLIEHRYIQRLRRIKQLGLSALVYPGANHTRFEHALGALHLMYSAINVLRAKKVKISNEEAEAAMIAILLHDIGHGPFSHALEHTIVKGVKHEQLSLLLMEQLNIQFGHKLQTAILIFTNNYPKKFLHQLVSSQLDMDRMDYLRRDSFFSGVVEGTIGSDRIIKMLDVRNGHLVVEKKGIYSVEKFLIARRLMYWQVYLHKTVIAAEHILINVLKRAKQLTKSGRELFAPPPLKWFLENDLDPECFEIEKVRNEMIENFINLDDSDLISSIKVWCNESDFILSYLSKAIVDRKLLRIKITDKAIPKNKIEKLTNKAYTQMNLSCDNVGYLVFTGEISNSIYETNSDDIMVLTKSGKAKNLEEASDIDLKALTRKVTKHYICYPKELE